MLYNELPAFTDLNSLDTIRDASQRTPFLTIRNMDRITNAFDVIIKVMGTGNIHGKINKLDAQTDSDTIRLMKTHLACLMQEDLVKQVDLCIQDGQRALIVFDGDNCQEDSPFTLAIVTLAKKLNCPVLSVRGKVTPDKWRPDHVNEKGPKCTIGTWPSDVEMRMAWVEGSTPAEATLGMADRVLVYGAADLFVRDGASTTTSMEMACFLRMGIVTSPLSSWADQSSYWSVYGKNRSDVV